MFCNHCGTNIADGVSQCPSCKGVIGDNTATEPTVNMASSVAPITATPETSYPSQQAVGGYSEQSAAANTAPEASSAEFGEWQGGGYGNISGTSPMTGEMQDVQENKIYATLSYLSILFLIPLFVAKESKFAQFHAWQGARLCGTWLIYKAAYALLSWILLEISSMFGFILIILNLANWLFLVLAVIGILNVWKGQMVPLPLLGNIKLPAFINKANQQ